MSEERVEAILSVRDQGYFSAMEKARKAAEGLGQGIDTSKKQTSSFTDTLLGMAGAIGVTALVSKGFDMIKDSVGKAMDRADTMANFTRTMTLMTGSTDKANGALEDLRGLATGTAYGLDVAAKATQGLVTSGMGIQDSTKFVGGWMDAVSTYGDGTNATLQNVTFQLSQMASKGKANLGDLKSAMEAGIPVIKIYAEATGQSAQVVSDQISKGAISSENFMKVMDEAFRSGTKSFAKIEGSAKKAGGTWKGTFDNMQAATTRGMLAIITAIEDARVDQGVGGMKDAIKEFGKSTEAVLKNVAGVAGFVAAHFETLSTVLVTGLSAWAGYRVVDDISGKLRAFDAAAISAGKGLNIFLGAQGKSVTVADMYSKAMKDSTTAEQMKGAARKLNIELEGKSIGGITMLNNLTDKQKALILAETGALSIKSLVLAVVDKRITLATAAQIAWNIAMTANPIGLIIAGIAALGAALNFFNKKLNETSKEHKNANEEAQRQADANKSLTRSTSDLGRAYESNTTDAKANGAEARRMVDNLKKIQASTMDAETKQYAMADAVKELNTQYPELNVSLDETGEAIEGSTDAIYKQIDAMESQAKMEAMKEYLKELYKKQIEYGVAIDQTTEQMDGMTASGTNAQKTWFGLGTKTTDEFGKLKDSAVLLNTGLDDTNSKISTMEKQLNITSEAQLRSRMEAKADQEELATLTEKYGVTTFAILHYADEHEMALDKIGKSLFKLSAKYKLSTDEIMQAVSESGLTLEEWDKQYGELSKVADKYKMTTADVAQAVKDQGLSLDEWAKQHQLLIDVSEKYSLTTTSIQKAVKTQGISLEQFAKNHDKNLKQAEEAIDKYVGAASDGWGKLEQSQTISLKKYMENMEANRKATQNWTKNVDILMKAGIDEGIIKHLESMGPAGAAQAEVFVKELKKLNGGTLGEYDSLNANTKKKLDELAGVTKKGQEAGGAAARTAIKAQNYRSMGSNIVQDMENGMVSEMSGLNEKANKTGSGVHSNIVSGVNKTELRNKMIASGRFAMDGLDEGMDQKKGTIYDTAISIANTISKKFRAALSINSPSGLFRKFGNHIDDGLILGLEDGYRDVGRASQKMADMVSGAKITPPTGLKSANAGSTHQGAKMEVNFALGKQAYRAFIEDITKTQDSEVALELKYT